ncbi:MAG: HAMP domain-containing protein [Bryobacterales bacterium]|nr:HAMP domain-containing protein [Bryobacterales bacterium]
MNLQPITRLARGIRFRIAATCWFVTLLALGLYLAVNLPQQQKDLLDALASKAKGVSSSLQEVTAGAALSEDYSSVVDHCINILSGDDAIDYLVITRTDGFSVVVHRDGWRTETLGGFWRPGTRDITGGIGHVPLVGKRVYSYTRPFDYASVQWGWIHVGLSTVAFDSSVSDVYRRSAMLAVLAAALSLLVAFYQARRLVSPIVNLQGVVSQVASGDLSARADIRSGDEVEALGQAFNSMAATIGERNQILQSLRVAGQLLLSTEDWTTVAARVLAEVGRASAVSRAYLFENHTAADGAILSSERFEWVAPGVPSTLARWQNFRWADFGVAEWSQRLAAGKQVVATFPSDSHLVPAGFDSSIQLMISTPILVGGDWWGWAGFDLCGSRRELSAAERDSFQAVADMLGAAISRQIAKQALLHANENLERRVLERTSELEEQVRARETANRQLAEAQQRLMDLSRQAGMAEVATGVLHNVGNVLNSVNVSATVVANKIRESRVGNLNQVAALLRENAADLPAFLTADPKGQRVIEYIGRLGAHLESEREIMLRELELLTGHIGHIKEIVATQQNYAKVSGLIEVIPLPDLIEDALRIVAPGLERHGIHVERHFAQIPPASVDKHSVLQILLNLLRNAKQALDDSHLNGAPRRKLVHITLASPAPGRFAIQVRDNGVGLSPENLLKIFSHGFTTRRDGHGFGLHSGANAARRMGGSLSVASDGPGLGAVFTLELPIDPRNPNPASDPKAEQEPSNHEYAAQ